MADAVNSSVDPDGDHSTAWLADLWSVVSYPSSGEAGVVETVSLSWVEGIRGSWSVLEQGTTSHDTLCAHVNLPSRQLRHHNDMILKPSDGPPSECTSLNVTNEPPSRRRPLLGVVVHTESCHGPPL